MTNRSPARALAKKHLADNDPLGWFEPLYAGANDDPTVIPWADRRPNPNLLAWLDAHPAPPRRTALKVGCGLGDDAEELARRGFRVTAFDIAPTAIAWCRSRFPDSTVRYATADLLSPPAEWTGAFDFVLESYTLQVLPTDLRLPALLRLSRFLAPRGELLLICRGRVPINPPGEMPWPLTREELSCLADRAGLAEKQFEDFVDAETPPVRRFRAVYCAANLR